VIGNPAVITDQPENPSDVVVVNGNGVHKSEKS
jgi:hypothetical protein